MAAAHGLAGVHERLVRLAELVVAAIGESATAFNKGDAQSAERALETCAATVRLAGELDAAAMSLPTEQALSPREVQALICYGHTSMRLARMGDFARHIAGIARRYAPNQVAPEELSASFVQMAAQAGEAARHVVRVVRGDDPALIDALVEDDHWTDVLQHAAFAAVEAPGWTGGTERAVYMILVARYLERFGDQAALIATRLSALRAAEPVSTSA